MTSEQSPTIRLDQFLKIVGVVGTGGQAKLLIQSGEVSVNGEVEIRRRRQLRDGDEVLFEGEEYTVEISAEDENADV